MLKGFQLTCQPGMGVPEVEEVVSEPRPSGSHASQGCFAYCTTLVT